MPFSVLDSTPFFTDEARTYLLAHSCQIKRCTVEGLREDEFSKKLEGVQAVIDGGENWNADMFDRARSLKILARRGVGFDSVEVAGSTSRLLIRIRS